ncbi:MAG: glycerophosphodiester phosphodiesterase [Bacteroidales bacterium]|nr:glycerophosphodiester phosphodiesterase [Candidatus Cacconaster merdequi]
MKKYLVSVALVAVALLSAMCTKPVGPQVVAHRGYWDIEGSAQNSLEALRQAGEHNFYGSEFDVNLTADDVLVVNHDFTFHGIMIDENPYSAIKDSTLANGEVIPTLDQYLDLFLQYPQLQLVFELKSKGDADYEARAIPMLLEKLEERGLTSRTDFISFSLTACQEVAKRVPEMMVEYLGGEIAPAELKAMGINGIDYHYSALEKHPEWVEEAHSLGMVCNAWTVNTEEKINEMLELGADFITTNAPELAEQLIAARAEESK